MNVLCDGNNVVLIGRKASDFVFSHETAGEYFYKFTLESSRYSSTPDRVPVVVSDRIIGTEDYNNGSVCVIGQVRSFDRKTKNKKHLEVFVFATDMFYVDEPDKNEVSLKGYVCRPPVYRATPNGRQITDIMLSVPRHYKKSDYIPCIAWGRNAKFASGLEVGTYIGVTARFQSREYPKTENDETEQRIAYEMSVSKIERLPYE